MCPPNKHYEKNIILFNVFNGESFYPAEKNLWKSMQLIIIECGGEK